MRLGITPVNAQYTYNPEKIYFVQNINGDVFIIDNYKKYDEFAAHETVTASFKTFVPIWINKYGDINTNNVIRAFANNPKKVIKRFKQKSWASVFIHELDDMSQLKYLFMTKEMLQ